MPTRKDVVPRLMGRYGIAKVYFDEDWITDRSRTESCYMLRGVRDTRTRNSSILLGGPSVGFRFSRAGPRGLGVLLGSVRGREPFKPFGR
jgi:hypothetical protein